MKTSTVENELSIWVLTDGRAGNVAQAMGLAEAVARRRLARIHALEVSLKPWAARVPAWLSRWLGAREGGWPFSGLAAGAETLSPPWPDLIIGAGRRSAPVIAALGRLHGPKTVQLLDPQMPISAFDLVVAPLHDRLTGPNVIGTLGSVGRMTPERIAASAASWRERLSHLPEPRIAVLLGGTSKSAVWRREDIDRLVEEMDQLSRSGYGLMITPSRRSDPAMIEGLCHVCDASISFLWEGDGENPYPGIVGLANAVIVTEDSVNMASEAAASGLPVHVFRVSKRAKKIVAFHGALRARGISRDYKTPLEHWNYEPLDEAGRVADALLERLFPPH